MMLAFAAIAIAFFAWWFATGVVILIARAPVRRPASVLVPATVLAVAGFVALLTAADTVSVGAVYVAFFAALAIWAFHEVTFLLGYVVGPRRVPCSPDARGRRRFRLAFMAVRDHELALFLTGLVLVLLLFDAANPFGWMLYALMWFMRLSTKLNIFLGAPNAISEILPEHMDYLTSYFRTDRMHPFFILSVTAITGILTACVFMAVTAGTPAMITGWSLMATFAFLGLVEHLFLVLPVRDAALWGWAVGGTNKGGLLGPATPSQSKQNKKTAAPVAS